MLILKEKLNTRRHPTLLLAYIFMLISSWVESCCPRRRHLACLGCLSRTIYYLLVVKRLKLKDRWSVMVLHLHVELLWVGGDTKVWTQHLQPNLMMLVLLLCHTASRFILLFFCFPDADGSHGWHCNDQWWQCNSQRGEACSCNVDGLVSIINNSCMRLLWIPS